jgi:DNA-binding winged helix-turn-helix (wHTH) protein
MTLAQGNFVPNTEIQNIDIASSPYALGSVKVYPESLNLVVDGTECRVEPKIMDLLAYFSARPGQVLAKGQILSDVWGGTHVVEEALQRAVSILRKTLGDDRENPVFIETISKKGYRFLVTPKPLGEPEADEINITEKNIKTSPLILLIGAGILILLTYVVINSLTDQVPLAPQANGDSGAESTESAPVPKPDSQPEPDDD